jgi:hypothetical protein
MLRDRTVRVGFLPNSVAPAQHAASRTRLLRGGGGHQNRENPLNQVSPLPPTTISSQHQHQQEQQEQQGWDPSRHSRAHSDSQPPPQSHQPHQSQTHSSNFSIILDSSILELPVPQALTRTLVSTNSLVHRMHLVTSLAPFLPSSLVSIRSRPNPGDLFRRSGKMIPSTRLCLCLGAAQLALTGMVEVSLL